MTKYDKQMITDAESWGENLSTCKKRKVGAVIGKGVHPISHGYNGTLPSTLVKNEKYTDNNCEDADGKTKVHVSHAEFNALMHMFRKGESAVGCTLYVTTKPCRVCADLIIHSGIKKVFYKDDDRTNEGVDYLNDVGIEMIPYTEK